MKLKICGLKTVEDIDCVNQAGVDYAGFVFAPSRVQIGAATARTLKKALRPDIQAVGVFVDEPLSFIHSLLDAGIIDMVQFHGDREYPLACPAIRAFRMRTKQDIKPTACDFVLFDACKQNANGSTGAVFDWRLIEGYRDKPFFLAGGINSLNIREAVALQPYGIDISSGVEENGKKSLHKIMEAAAVCRQTHTL